MINESLVFEIEIGSPLDYENLVAYIIVGRGCTLREMIDGSDDENKKKFIANRYIETDQVAILHQEEGKDKVKIKFSDYLVDKEIYIDDLIQILQKAKKELIR